jgi:hypothetical protein
MERSPGRYNDEDIIAVFFIKSLLFIVSPLFLILILREKNNSNGSNCQWKNKN